MLGIPERKEWMWTVHKIHQVPGLPNILHMSGQVILKGAQVHQQAFAR